MHLVFTVDSRRDASARRRRCTFTHCARIVLCLLGVCQVATSWAVEGFLQRGSAPGRWAYAWVYGGDSVYIYPDSVVITSEYRPGSSPDTRSCLRSTHASFDLVPHGVRDTRWNVFLGSSAMEWASHLQTFQAIELRDRSNHTLRIGVTSEGVVATSPGGWGEVEIAGADEQLRISFEALLRDGGLVTLVDPLLPPQKGDLAGTGIVWSTFLGGSGVDIGAKVLVSDDGCPILVGWTSSIDLPFEWGSPEGLEDVFVAKLSEDGSALQWCTLVGGTAGDWPKDASLNRAGNIAVVGFTHSPDFPTTPGAFNRYGGGQEDAFALQLTSDGATMMWSTYLGGEEPDGAFAVACDDSFNVCVAGYTLSPDFPTTPDGVDPIYQSGYESFVLKLTPDGSRLVCSTLLKSSNAWDVLTLGANDILVTGSAGWLFPTTPGAYDESYNGYSDAFVCRLANDGRSLAWGSFVGGGDIDDGYRLTVGPSGEVFVMGVSRSADFPTTPESHDQTFNGFQDIVVLCLSADGRRLMWSTYLGGVDQDGFYGEADGQVALDAAGNLIVVARTVSPDYPTTSGALQPAQAGSWDGSISVLGGRLGRLLYSTYCGATGPDAILGIAEGNDGGWVLGGYTWAPTGISDFPTTPGAYDESYNGGYGDAYLMRLEALAVPVQVGEFQARRLQDSTVEVTWRSGVDDHGVGYDVWRGPNRETWVGGCVGEGGERHTIIDADAPGAAETYWLAAGSVWYGPVAVDSAGRGVWLRNVSEGNPSRDAAAFLVILPQGVRGGMKIYDLRGRAIRDLGWVLPGQWTVPWDGRDVSGRRCAPGVYLVRLKTPSGQQALKFTLIR